MGNSVARKFRVAGLCRAVMSFATAPGDYPINCAKSHGDWARNAKRPGQAIAGQGVAFTP